MCKWVARSGVLPGHPRGAEVPKTHLAPPPHMSMHIPARANGSSSTASPVLHNWTSHRLSPQAMEMLGDGRRQGPARGILHHLLNETSAGSKLLLSSVPSVGFRVHTQTTLALQPELLQTGTHGMSKFNFLVTPTAVFTKYIFKSGIFLIPQKRPVPENSVENKARREGESECALTPDFPPCLYT